MEAKQVPAGVTHFRKYDAMAKLFGAAIHGDRVLGLSRDQMWAKVQADQYLNNVKTLRHWDLLAASYVNRAHNLNSDGNSDDVRRVCSMAEAVCLVKHLVKYQWIGAEPLFSTPGDCGFCGNRCDLAPGRSWTCRHCGVEYHAAS